jgi:hypothetical protein
MEKSVDCRSCGGKVAFGRCLNCGVYPPPRRLWAYAALAIIAVAALDFALRGEGDHHVVTLASFIPSAWF